MPLIRRGSIFLCGTLLFLSRRKCLLVCKPEAFQGITIMAFTPRSEQLIAAMKRKISSLILMCGVNSFVDKANLKKSIRKYPSILTSECQPLLLTNFI